MNEKPLWTETHISNALGHGQSVLKPKAVALCLRIVSEYEATIDSLHQQLAEAQAWEPLDTYSEIYAVAEDGRKYTVGVDGDDAVYVQTHDDNSVMYLPDGYRLMRRRAQGGNE